MAVIWQKKIDGSLYQVRSAGKTRRLYTNGICHSEFNPDRVVTGSIWDLLVLPAFFHTHLAPARILMLGVGGGASILQLHHLLEGPTVVGVELNPVHLELAQRFFDIDTIPARLYQAEAGEWLQNYKGAAFDLIIDDLFTNEGKEPVRSVSADSDWFALLSRHLAEDGKLVLNFASSEEFKRAAYFINKRVNRNFKQAFRFSNPQLDNIVGAFIQRESSSTELRENLRANPLLGRALQNRQLRYHVRDVSVIV